MCVRGISDCGRQKERVNPVRWPGRDRTGDLPQERRRNAPNYPRAATACLAASTNCSAARFIFFNSAAVTS